MQRASFVLLATALGACAAPRQAPRDADQIAFDAEFADASVKNPHLQRQPGERLALRVRSAGLGSRTLPDCSFTLRTTRLDERGRPTAEAIESRITRTRDRLHLLRGGERAASTPEGEEWMFERNPVAPDELGALRVDHGSRYLVEYTDGDLHMEGVADGWASLARGFVGVEELAGLRPSGTKRSAHGAEFERFLGERKLEGSIAEVDWSDALGLPLRVVRVSGNGTSVQELIGLQLGTQEMVLRPFASRWPDYRRKELSDWREDVHDHDHSQEHKH